MSKAKEVIVLFEGKPDPRFKGLDRKDLKKVEELKKEMLSLMTRDEDPTPEQNKRRKEVAKELDAYVAKAKDLK